MTLVSIGEAVVDEPTSCATKRTGELSDDFIGKQCINLREVDTSNEVKRMIEDITGVKTSWRSPGGIWGTGDENALLLWATENPASALASTVSPLVQKTPAGWTYPTGDAIVDMLETLGCAPNFGGAQPNCQRYPRLADWWLQHGRLSVRSVYVEPPMFGAPSEPPLPQEQPPPGVRPPGAAPPGLDTEEPFRLGAAGLLLVGAAVGGAIYYLARLR